MSSDDLERSLGLYPTLMISIGAMVGSGIFVLPAIGFAEAGPGVILAYLLAALVVLPAALSKAELGTAMPESGGDYIYIERALGPLAGTVAGIGAWFSLTFKSAFALVGLGAYLLVLTPLGATQITLVGLGLAVLIVVLNISGTELTGEAQAVVVTIVLVGLFAYVANTAWLATTGAEAADLSRLSGLADSEPGIVFTAAALVFVSYAGVTKIASVAEEVKHPDKNLPRGILGSLGVMAVVYLGVIGSIVVLNPPAVLTTGGAHGASLTPMADGANALFGGFGVPIVSALAIIALISMANAGVLSSSRFPLAMSRDNLLPDSLGVIDSRFKTPRNSILLTGSVLLLLIAFVPVITLAEMASAFIIFVLSVINLALIAFREANLETYDPAFRAPGYPVIQVVGTVAGFGMIVRLGLLPIVGAAGITVGGAVIYLLYGRKRTDSTSALGVILSRRREGEDPQDAVPAEGD
jgi:APA family basic amino acid/polyamine antiporter